MYIIHIHYTCTLYIVHAYAHAYNLRGFFALVVGSSSHALIIGSTPLPQVLAEDVSEYAGQAVAIALAKTQMSASKMVQAVRVSYQSLGKPILTIKDAIAQNSFFNEPGSADVFTAGDAESRFKILLYAVHVLWLGHV